MTRMRLLVGMLAAAGLALFVGFLVLRAYAPVILVPNSIPVYAPVDAALREELRALAVNRDPTPPRDYAATARRDLERTADNELRPWTHDNAKGWVPRVLLAKLAVGGPGTIAEVNEYLLAQTPWGTPGSSWELHTGDYDFTEKYLIQMVYLFGDDPERLYPETVRHLLDVLIVEHGTEQQLMVPETWDAVYDTENHILMREVTRYLRNQWLWNRGEQRPETDNAGSGFTEWMLEYLNGIRTQGFYEFNSPTYASHAMYPIMHLATWAEPPELRGLAIRVLDDKFARAAWSTLPGPGEQPLLMRSVPFRRRFEDFDKRKLDLFSSSQWLRYWAGDPDSAEPGYGAHPMVLLTGYRPPERVVELAHQKPGDYFLRIGHAQQGCPEVVSGGRRFVLSGGGAYHGELQKTIPRPVVLLLQDNAKTVDECFHIPGGGDWTSWNTTGVYRQIAVANAPVVAPERYEPYLSSGGWSVYAVQPTPESDDVDLVVTYSAERFGLLAVLPGGDESPLEVFESMRRANPHGATLRRSFQWPFSIGTAWTGTRVAYDVQAAAGEWVIESADGETFNRSYEGWPLFDLVQSSD